jgi:phenylacetyl-CoA:acceptor oxidoreductase subunit 1
MGVSWPRIVALETGTDHPNVSNYSVRCNHCKNAPCVTVCPTGATYQREDGIVIIDQNKCVGCRYCIIACPYQNRTFVSRDKDRGFFPGRVQTDFEKAGKKRYPHQLGTTEKCNFCAERIDEGMKNGFVPGRDRAATPACVNTCPARALTFGDLDNPNSDVSQLIRANGGFQLHPEYDTDPSIFFIDGPIGSHDRLDLPGETRKERILSGVSG